MSQDAEIENNLERIAELAPLNAREKELARMQFRVLLETPDIAEYSPIARRSYLYLHPEECPNPECESGAVDSGGFDPQGNGIMVGCPYCSCLTREEKKEFFR